MIDKDGCHARDAIRIQNTEVQINRGLTSMDQIDPEINLARLHPPRQKKLKILNQFDVNCLQMKLLNPNIMLKRHFNQKLNLPPCSKFVFFLSISPVILSQVVKNVKLSYIGNNVNLVKNRTL